MGVLATLLGSQLPQRYRKYFDIPECAETWKLRDTKHTTLGSVIGRWREQHAEADGVLRLDLGTDALGMRVGLIDCAERSVDIQSYLIRDDISGNLIAAKLADAAGRGVRVRLLLDDALTHPIDTGLLSLDDHENIEVRVFNPFPRRRSRVVSFIANFNVLNRRMHNKSFTVDNQVAIVGGRNLADEYYRADGKNEFIDEDLLLVGPIVEHVSDGFDEYWNSPESFPMRAFDKLVPHRGIEEMERTAKKYLKKMADAPILREFSTRSFDSLIDGSMPLIAANTRLIMDQPQKVRHALKRPDSETSEFLTTLVSQARDEVLIVSPYFVPQKRGVRFLAGLVKDGVRVTIITNSLASTNHSSVHAAYARYRKPLLRLGVELYELKPAANGNDSNLKMTLHAKVASVDKSEVFVGSFNLDPRSLYINTEMGVSVSSNVLAAQMSDSIRAQLDGDAYHLFLSDSGRLLWRHQDGGLEIIASVEPHTSLWRRLTTKLMSLLPIESQM